MLDISQSPWFFGLPLRGTPARFLVLEGYPYPQFLMRMRTPMAALSIRPTRIHGRILGYLGAPLYPPSSYLLPAQSPEADAEANDRANGISFGVRGLNLEDVKGGGLRGTSPFSPSVSSVFGGFGSSEPSNPNAPPPIASFPLHRLLHQDTKECKGTNKTSQPTPRDRKSVV